MKKLIIIAGLIFALVGCQQPPQTTKENKIDTDTKNDTKKDYYKINEPSSPAPEFFITLSSYEKKEIKGNLYQSGEPQINGEYFKIGNNIVKASDYYSVICNFDLQNKSKNEIPLSPYAWQSFVGDNQINDRSRLNGIIIEKSLPNSNGKGEIEINLKNDEKIEDIIINYFPKMGSSEWSSDLRLVMSQKMNEEEFKEKYAKIKFVFKLLK